MHTIGTQAQRTDRYSALTAPLHSSVRLLDFLQHISHMVKAMDI